MKESKDEVINVSQEKKGRHNIQIHDKAERRHNYSNTKLEKFGLINKKHRTRVKRMGLALSFPRGFGLCFLSMDPCKISGFPRGYGLRWDP